MIIIDGYKKCPAEATEAVIALGNFDGVHIGHQEVLKTAKKIADEELEACAVMTFDPHPSTILRPENKNITLTNFKQKSKFIEELKINYLFKEHFDKDFSKITAEDFIRNILSKSLKASHIVIGRDFIFGHNRGGDSVLLKKICDELGIGFTQVKAIGNNTETFSSSAIRSHIKNGQLSLAKQSLGYNFTIEGEVTGGDERGRVIGFPTANVELGHYVRPLYGVYAVHVHVSGSRKKLNAIANIGVRPSFNENKELLEVHIFDFNDDLYGEILEVEFIDFIRKEEKFLSIDDLKNQIEKDCVVAKERLQNSN